jgi:hypothetical protein
MARKIWHLRFVYDAGDTWVTLGFFTTCARAREVYEALATTPPFAGKKFYINKVIDFPGFEVNRYDTDDYCVTGFKVVYYPADMSEEDDNK